MGDFPAEQEPDGNVAAPHHFYIGTGVMVFAFASIWPLYPVTGASLTILGLVIAADDVLSHVFGVWTPLDWVWKVAIRPNLPGDNG
jgi:hypothetical protein